MTMPSSEDDAATFGSSVRKLYEAAEVHPPASLLNLVVVLGARRRRSIPLAGGRLRAARPPGVCADGTVGPPEYIEGTLAGRVFAGGTAVASGATPTLVRVPLLDGTERIGMLEFEFDQWDPNSLLPDPLLIRTFVLLTSIVRAGP